MKVEKTVNVTLESKEKKIVKKFTKVIDNMCNNYDCDICPIKKQCTSVNQALVYLQSL